MGSGVYGEVEDGLKRWGWGKSHFLNLSQQEREQEV